MSPADALVAPTELPRPRTPDPMTAPALRWGVMGSGWIAEKFVRSVQQHTTQQIVALSSRDAQRAAATANLLDIPSSYGSYAEMAADPDIDVVYVAVGHAEHVDCARTALEHGKHTLVEKPLALNAVDAADLAELAGARDLFLAEAVWSFFLPKYDVVRQVLESGVLGEIRSVIADNGELFEADHRILRADQAGGPMADLGTYPVSLATWVMGEVTAVLASSVDHPAGVHGQVAAVLTDDRGTQASLHTSVFGGTPVMACIAGTRGMLTLSGPFYMPGDLVLIPFDGGPSLLYTEPNIAHDALYFEAAEVARCVAAGHHETPLRPLADTIATLRAMDAIRATCQITYPGEDNLPAIQKEQ
jgi:predicted dehydrogenase